MLNRVGERLPARALDELLDFSVGMSGAQIVAAVREMTLADELDVRAGREILESIVFGEKVENYAAGMREVIAYHEAGHAVAHLAADSGRVDYVSMSAREHSAGHIWTSRETVSAPGLLAIRAMLATLMAGRMAQRICFGDLDGADSGDASDLDKATRLAWEAIAHWGLDPDVGPIHLPDADSGIRMPELERRIEDRVGVWLRQAESQAQTLLKQHWSAVEAVAAALLDQGALAHDALYDLVNQASPTLIERSTT